jgi:hypothetical protein
MDCSRLRFTRAHSNGKAKSGLKLLFAEQICVSIPKFLSVGPLTLSDHFNPTILTSPAASSFRLPALSPANDESRLLAEVTCEVKGSPEYGYSNGGNGGWPLQWVLAIKSIQLISRFRQQRKTSSVGKE